MTTQYLGMERLGEDFEKQIRAMKKSISAVDWNRKVIGEGMIMNVVTGFLRGEDPEGKKWMSPSDETAHGGRFSAAYKERPSGKVVGPSSLRLSDTGELRDSYQVTQATSSMVEVGPKPGSTSEKIASRAEESWGNAIAGWGPRGYRIIDAIIEKALHYIAQGKPVPKYGYQSSAQSMHGRLR